MKLEQIKDFIDSHLGKVLEITTKSWVMIAEVLKEQHPDEFYRIDVKEGDITDVEYFRQEEQIHIWNIVDVKEAA